MTMHKNLFVLDPRDTWVDPQLQAARARGWNAKRIYTSADADGPGYSFVRPHAHPVVLKSDQRAAHELAAKTTLIQDMRQIDLYEDKRGQTALWNRWMPKTWVPTSLDEAMAVLREAPYPLISKADVGASSYNVRLLRNIQEAEAHVRQIFEGGGIRVRHCAGGEDAWSNQNDYAILQEFVPHHVTYRVNIVGRERAIFFRYCYADRPMAQTGNVEPAYALNPELESLLEYSDRFFAEADTKWCAIDVLKAADGWKLLETSLAWPWPSPGDCNNAAFFPSGRKWISMFDIMVEQIEAGVWG